MQHALREAVFDHTPLQHDDIGRFQGGKGHVAQVSGKPPDVHAIARQCGGTQASAATVLLELACELGERENVVFARRAMLELPAQFVSGAVGVGLCAVYRAGLLAVFPGDRIASDGESDSPGVRSALFDGSGSSNVHGAS